MIKLNEKWSFESDRYNWILYEWNDGTNKNGESIKSSKKTYYPNLRIMFTHVLDQSLKEADTLKDMMLILDKYDKIINLKGKPNE